MKKRTFSITLEVDIDDAKALKVAARKRAVIEGQTPREWASMRSSIADDLTMLLDPGSIPGSGISIESSVVEEISV